MNFRPILIALTLSFVLPSAAIAQAPADDPGNAKTPMSLIELLPENDKDWPKPFSLIIEMEGRRGDTESIYMRWQMAREGKDIVMGMSFGEDDTGTKTSLTYSPEGKLKTFTSERSRPGRYTRTVTGKVVGDKIEVTRLYTSNNAGREPNRSTETLPLASIEGSAMLEWTPLIVAYHARQGSLGYTVRLRIVEDLDNQIEFKAEDVGTEVVVVDGKEQTAHVLVVEAYPVRENGERREDDVAKLAMTFLKTGGFVNATFAVDEMKAKAQRVTEEEIEKRFGKPEPAGE